MENITIQQIIDLTTRLSIPGVVGLVAVLLWKGGIIDALSTWIRKSPESAIAREFRDFKATAEGNHYTDLESLVEWRRQLDVWKASVDHRLTQMGEDVAYLRGKMGNGHK